MSASLEEIQMNTPLFAYSLGVRDEQERIIKLLKDHMPNSSDHDFVGCECEFPTNTWYNDHIIALIKGERK